ncbi:hypothetical protein EUGRSUZ_H00545 [Eucalyptus grandis]|uniref:Uncharacterized protein n=2 Tax=Eucalyptus grandis TaxID=71139 RepID=A0ACC3JP36_EUCGR|nr:hypothetical protein EUGRSUZ_H00545 [Eucalyptus grandis]
MHHFHICSMVKNWLSLDFPGCTMSRALGFHSCFLTQFCSYSSKDSVKLMLIRHFPQLSVVTVIAHLDCFTHIN